MALDFNGFHGVFLVEPKPERMTRMGDADFIDLIIEKLGKPMAFHLANGFYAYRCRFEVDVGDVKIHFLSNKRPFQSFTVFIQQRPTTGRVGSDVAVCFCGFPCIAQAPCCVRVCHLIQHVFQVVREHAQDALPCLSGGIPFQCESTVVEVVIACSVGGGNGMEAKKQGEKNECNSVHGTKLGRGNLRSMSQATKLLDTASAVMVSEEAQRCWTDMQSATSIVITAHRSPDGDAVGSALGLHHHLKSQGIESTVVLPDRFPGFLDWMPGAEAVVIYEEETEQASQKLNEAEVIWCLDFNGLDRVGKMEGTLRMASGKKWVVDHHQHPDDFADRLFSDPSCGSTCELIADLIAGWKQAEQMTEDAMACLYVGIMTDTGSFRFPSVTAHTHDVLSHFLRLGLSHAEIHQNTFDQQSLNRVQLQGFAVSERLHMWEGYDFALIGLKTEDLERFGYQSGDTEGLVNKALALKGIRVAIMAREAEPGLIKLSLRSVGAFSVRDVAAAEFDGGGHMNAAGGIVKGMSMDAFVAHVGTRLGDWFAAEGR